MGEGKHLRMPLKEDFETLLRKYERTVRELSVLGLKDNLINLIRQEKGLPPFGGCTGYGCGAAFNFIAVLPDGEVHACRKFPSPIGNVQTDRLIDIYRSDLAEKYRNGSDACRSCRLSPICRGCLAVTYSCGLDVFTDKDPFCFISEETPGDPWQGGATVNFAENIADRGNHPAGMEKGRQRSVKMAPNRRSNRYWAALSPGADWRTPTDIPFLNTAATSSARRWMCSRRSSLFRPE